MIARRGYTLVELMMALAVLAIGIGGVFAMQKVTITSNGQAKNLALATHIAESWLDELSAEGGQWNDFGDFNDGVWLAQVGAEEAAAGNWFRPAFSEARKFGPAFDALGSYVPAADVAERAHFCSDLRLRWMSSQTAIKTGAGLVRAEVRVFWRREGIIGLTGDLLPSHACDVLPAEVDSDEGRRLFHVVYLSTAIRQQMGAIE